MIANLMLSPKIISDCPEKQFLESVEGNMTLLILLLFNNIRIVVKLGVGGKRVILQNLLATIVFGAIYGPG